MNLGEALYIEARSQGYDRAEKVITSFAQQLLIAEEADSEVVRAAAMIKAQGGVSYSDCFAIATAERHGAPLLTGDPEILAIRRPALTTVDLRSS